MPDCLIALRLGMLNFPAPPPTLDNPLVLMLDFPWIGGIPAAYEMVNGIFEFEWFNGPDWVRWLSLTML